MSAPTTTLKLISSRDIAWTEWSAVPRFGLRYRHLSLATIGPDYRVGVAIEGLPPGKQTVPAHLPHLRGEARRDNRAAMGGLMQLERAPLAYPLFLAVQSGRRRLTDERNNSLGHVRTPRT
jgi:hypothetical protein